MEMRAPWEFGALLPAWFALQRAPRGDGHPVHRVSRACRPATRRPCRCAATCSDLGSCTRSAGTRASISARAPVSCARPREQLEEAVAQCGRKASLIGWSLGGIYARELAKQMPDLVRSVVTLGTPFAGNHTSTNAWRSVRTGQRPRHRTRDHQFDLPQAPSMPTSSIFSRTDGVVAWKASLQAPLLTQSAYGKHRGGGQPCRAGDQPQHLVGAGRPAGAARRRWTALRAQTAACTASSFPTRIAQPAAQRVSVPATRMARAAPAVAVQASANAGSWRCRP